MLTPISCGVPYNNIQLIILIPNLVCPIGSHKNVVMVGINNQGHVVVTSMSPQPYTVQTITL